MENKVKQSQTKRRHPNKVKKFPVCAGVNALRGEAVRNAMNAGRGTADILPQRTQKTHRKKMAHEMLIEWDGSASREKRGVTSQIPLTLGPSPHRMGRGRKDCERLPPSPGYGATIQFAGGWRMPGTPARQPRKLSGSPHQPHNEFSLIHRRL